MILNFVCPRCRQALHVAQDAQETECAACKSIYPLRGRAWDLRTILEKKEINWKAENFDAAYIQEGEFHDGFEHARQLRIPIFLEEYRISRVKDRIAKWIAEKKGGRLLDIGCGNGWYDFRLRQKWGFQGEIMGVDISPFRVNVFLKEIAKRGESGMDAVCSNAETLPFPNDYFDQIVMTEVLEHVVSPENAFREIARVLKEDGEVFVTTPSGPMCDFWEACFSVPRKIKHIFTGKKKSAEENYVYDKALSKKQIVDALDRAGLRLVHYHKSVFLPHESYLQFFPGFILRLMLFKAYILEALGPLTNFLGLHHIIRAKKK
jgi:ubiquinone/menaquinone biosynthesis C-methylase UbiE